MTLRELLQSVSTEQYNDSPLYYQLCHTKPEYGTKRRIEIKKTNGELLVTGVHVGSLGDILTYSIDVDPNLNISNTQLLDAILKELASYGFTTQEQEDFWSDFDNLQKAKIIR